MRLADIDGSGTTDILYLGREEIAIWLNQAGNGFRQYGREPGETPLTQFPTVDDLAAMQAIDLLGNGTACLVWSSPLPGQSWQPMRYIDLMGGQKPHLMTSVVNNLGAETKLQYAASTKFYLQDRAAGTPWITRLPFPVHVVERVETIDHLTGNRFVSLYRYRHGYFDGEEREFRGFGYVEQTDTEAYAELAKGNLFPVGTNEEASAHVPPVQTKTWFHTGAFIDREHLSTYFAEKEYYREPRHRIPENATEAERRKIEAEFQAMLLPDTVLPGDLTLPDGTGIPHRLTAQEEREACRALKGSVLRQEVYALDGTAEAEHPYTVTESNYEIRQVQPRQGEQYGVFFVHPRGSLAYHYERHPEDPRVAHQMTLAVDGFGNVLKSVAIAYPRRIPTYPEQAKTLITYTENRVTNKPNAANWYRIGVPLETCTYEITGIGGGGSAAFVPLSLDFMRSQLAVAIEIPYEAFASAGVQKRLIERVRSHYRPNPDAQTTDPSRLPLGEIDSLALPCESFKLAFTPGLLAQVYGANNGDKIGLTDLEPLLGGEGRYVQLEDGNWWIPSGRQAFDPAQFYQVVEAQDPFGSTYRTTYDDHALLTVQTQDPLNNVIALQNNYWVMQPWEIKDPNGNRSQVKFDALGMVVGTAVMGKETESLGDSFVHFQADLTPDDIAALFQASDPRAIAIYHLGTATTRFIYDLEAVPVRAAAIARTEHESDLQGQSLQRHQVQVSFVYSDGFGRELQTKVQAEPEDRNHPQLRWVGTGRKVYNNKGKPVKQYEPFFSQTYQYETETALVESGVTPLLFYDPLERVVATLHPNHTYEKVVFDAWQQATWDGNDTVIQAQPHRDLAPLPTDDPDVGHFFRVLEPEDYLEFRHPDDPNDIGKTWYQARIDGFYGAAEKSAAEKAAAHAGTPTIAHLDTLGRTFQTIADNGQDQAGNPLHYATHVTLDIEGNQLVVTDARQNPVMIYGIPQRDGEGKPIKDAQGKPVLVGRGFDLLSHSLYSYSGDAGERWTLTNVAGQPIRAWNSRGFTLRTSYDALLRPTHLFVKPENQQEILAERTVYGESHPETERNLKGKVYQVYDAAGVVTNEQYDFKGNLRSSQRQLSLTYRETMDWGAIAALTDLSEIAEAARPDLETQPNSQEPEIFRSETKFDALNRPMAMTTPDRSEIYPIYNEANLLERLEANLRGAETVTHFVSNIDYNAKGQRVLIEYGDRNAEGSTSVARTEYHYDPNTFRLIRLKTTRQTEPRVLQDLQYTYDPVGNITAIRDGAQQTIYFKGEVVSPHTQYEYDALYRLIQAEGREHRGQTGNQRPEHRADLKPHYDFNDATRTNLAHPHDGQAMRNYTEQYVYDSVGNILAMIHQADGNGWTRDYQYAQDSNRLLKTSLPPLGGLPQWGNYGYDAHGSMTQMPHLQVMAWDFKDQLQATQQQVVNSGEGEKTYYVYDAAGQRVRKVTELPAVNGAMTRRKNERIYLGGFEVYREYNGNSATVTLERETLHVMDDKQRIALVETKMVELKDSIINKIDSPKPLIHYQLNDHLGSACVELDEEGNVISYEEYYPYGSTSYLAVQCVAEVSLKRYRYTGQEQDEESGLFYHGARYYMSWLGRWTNCDSVGLIDGNNLYRYVQNNPIKLNDLDGNQSASPSELQDPGQTSSTLYWDRGKPVVIQEPNSTLANDPLLKDLAKQAQSLTKPGDYEGFRYKLNQLIKARIQSGDPRISQCFEVKGNEIVFRSGYFKPQKLNYAHIIGQKLIDNIGANKALKTDLHNLEPVGKKFHLDPEKLGHHEEWNTDYGKKLSPEAKAAIRAEGEEALARHPNALRQSQAPVKTSPRGFAILPLVTPEVAVEGALWGLVAFDVYERTQQTYQEQGTVMSVAQAGKTSAKHATNYVCLASITGAGLTVVATGGVASPVMFGVGLGILSWACMNTMNQAIDQATPNLH